MCLLLLSFCSATVQAVEVSVSSMLLKSMELKDKLPTMSEEDQLKLLATDGMLVKRPLLIGEDFVLVGFKESEWKEKF